MPIHTSLDLQGSDSRDWSIGPRKDFEVPDGCRQAICFPIELPVRYQAEGACCWGEIVNISSSRALFTTERELALDSCVVLYIKWPVLLHDSVQLSLIASGKIIGAQPGRATLAIERYEFRTCVRSFFQRPEPWPLPDCAAPLQQFPSESQMPQLQVALLAAGWPECPQRKFTGERTLLETRPATRAGNGHEISKTSRQTKVEVNNARWERIFQEKFADPEYYRTRFLPHSSPTSNL
jgi:hypothetical protein